MQRSVSDIVQTIATDPRPSSVDGCSNQDRIQFIMTVFGVEQLDINSKYDFSNLPSCKDIDLVEACKHLCLIQMQYAHEMHMNGHMGVDDLNLAVATLTLEVQRINWHLQHLRMDRETPPFPFIH